VIKVNAKNTSLDQASEILRMNRDVKIFHGEADEVAPATGLIATYKLRQVSGALQVNDRTVRNLVSRGLLKPIPGIRHLRFTAKEVNRFINNGK
jgi:hypothetical protein